MLMIRWLSRYLIWDISNVLLYQNSVPKIGVELDQKEVKPVMKTL